MRPAPCRTRQFQPRIDRQALGVGIKDLDLLVAAGVLELDAQQLLVEGIGVQPELLLVKRP